MYREAHTHTETQVHLANWNFADPERHVLTSSHRQRHNLSMARVFVPFLGVGRRGRWGGGLRREGGIS